MSMNLINARNAYAASLAAISKDAAFAHIKRTCATLNVDIIRVDLGVVNLSASAKPERREAAAKVTAASIVREAQGQVRTEDEILTALAQE